MEKQCATVDAAYIMYLACHRSKGESRCSNTRLRYCAWQYVVDKGKTDLEGIVIIAINSVDGIGRYNASIQYTRNRCQGSAKQREIFSWELFIPPASPSPTMFFWKTVFSDWLSPRHTGWQRILGWQPSHPQIPAFIIVATLSFDGFRWNISLLGLSGCPGLSHL